MANNETNNNIRVRATATTRFKFDPNKTASNIRRGTPSIPAVLADMAQSAPAPAAPAEPSDASKKSVTQSIHLQVVRNPAPAAAGDPSNPNAIKTPSGPRIDLSTAGSKATVNAPRLNLEGTHELAQAPAPKVEVKNARAATQQLPRINVTKPVAPEVKPIDPKADTSSVHKITTANATQTVPKIDLNAGKTATQAVPKIDLNAGKTATQAVPKIDLNAGKTATQAVPKIDFNAGKTATQAVPKIDLNAGKTATQAVPKIDLNAGKTATQAVPKVDLTSGKSATQSVPKIDLGKTNTTEKTQTIPRPLPKPTAIAPTPAESGAPAVAPSSNGGHKFSLKKTEESAAAKAHEPQAPTLEDLEKKEGEKKADAPAEVKRDTTAPAPSDGKVIEIGLDDAPFIPAPSQLETGPSKLDGILTIAASVIMLGSLYFMVMDLLKYL